jgi:hypothetical protein
MIPAPIWSATLAIAATTCAHDAPFAAGCLVGVAATLLVQTAKRITDRHPVSIAPREV